MILWLVGVLALGWVALRWYPPSPSIRFVGFRESAQGQAAVFQIVNDSRDSFSYYGEGPSLPFYSLRLPKGAGWTTVNLGWCGTGAGWHAIAPRSTIDFQVNPAEVPAAPFAVGILFERGTAAEVQTSAREPGILEWVRHQIIPGYGGPEPTWSTVAQPR